MNATAVLDAIARKHSSCALLREITVTDHDVVDPMRDAWKQWKPGNPMPPDYDGTPVYRRIDGLMLDGGATRTAIEVKISRADFLRETEEKRRPWRKITNRFVYATPAGLLKPEEIPDGCGLWEVDGNAVRIVKRAKSNPKPEPIPHQVLVALAYRLNRKPSEESL
ncbi:MmcB family DNA repair protein [Rhodococcus qingshengii]|uniref:MmcB family DNA repair protein n=1 Tax=Rhodococcus qingshengii TaxID=334542 RepID=UPI0037C908C6